MTRKEDSILINHNLARKEAWGGSFEQMKYIETAPGGQDAPGGAGWGARYEPLGP